MADMSAEKKQELQQRYMELQMYDAQIKQIQKQVQAIETQLMEVDQVRLSLDEFSKSATGSEILVPVASGMFAKAELRDNAKLLVNVGMGAVAERSVPEAQELLNGQAVELRKTQEELVQMLQKLATEAEKVEHAVNDLVTGA